MRLSLVWLIACTSHSAAPAPSNTAPTAANDWFARTTAMAPDSERRTYHLVRTADRIELDVTTEANKHEELGGGERSGWTSVATEHYAGSARDVNGSVELALDRGPAARARGRQLPAHLAWTCTRTQLRAHAASSRPVHVGPVSTAQTGCMGSPSEWQPDGMVTADVWLCGPAHAYIFHDVELAFAADKRAEWVAEWIDCHVQERGYRAWRD
jgi:hypothetical protein